jgi:hypothetical protein
MFTLNELRFCFAPCSEEEVKMGLCTCQNKINSENEVNSFKVSKNMTHGEQNNNKFSTNMNITPLKPSDVTITLPDYVIEATNNLIKKYYRGSRFDFTLEELIAEVKKVNPNVNEEELFERSELDIEKIFNENGWIVRYGSPSIVDDYLEYFEFTPNEKTK